MTWEITESISTSFVAAGESVVVVMVDAGVKGDVVVVPDVIIVVIEVVVPAVVVCGDDAIVVLVNKVGAIFHQIFGKIIYNYYYIFL